MIFKRFNGISRIRCIVLVLVCIRTFQLVCFGQDNQGTRFVRDATYLLVTNDKLANAFQPLVDRRTSQGKAGHLITVEDISDSYNGVDLQEKIRNCIKHYHEYHGTKWVLLGGDDRIVPMRYCKSPYDPNALVPADMYYADVNEGTWDEDSDGIYGELSR